MVLGQLFLKYVRFMRPYYRYLILIFVSDIFVSSFGLILPLFNRLLFDFAYPLRELFIVNVVVCAIFILYFTEFFLNVFGDYLQTYVDQSYTFDLTKRFFDKCQKLSLNFHASKTPGDLVQRLTTDIDNVVSRSIQTIPSLLINIYILASILIVAFSMNHRITLMALCSLPLYLLETKYFARKEERLEEEEIKRQSEYYNILQERFTHIRTIKAFGQEKRETEKVATKRRQMNIVAIKQGLVAVLSVFSNSVTVRIWTIFIGWYMGYLLIHQELSMGEVVAMIGYVGIIGSPIQSLMQTYKDIVVSMVSYRRLDEIDQAVAEDDTESHKKKELTFQKGEIRFEKVFFTYPYDPSNQQILENLSLTIKPKTAVAIVGESGAGKSTIIALLLKFFKINSGVIFIDGQDISELGTRSVRNQIGLVEQHCPLFEGTLRENIIYGCHGKSEEEIIASCRKAQIYKWIQQLPDGFETYVGINGEGLSAGQKQRVAMARVLLRDPPLIIMDEATSALDPESEYRITEVINNLIGKKNIIIVAHKLSTIKKVDTIFMLEGGKIVEQGSFSELVAKKEAFYRYYLRQYGGFDSFKQLLEIESERLQRYHSIFNLIAIRASLYPSIIQRHGIDFGESYMDEVELFFKKNLRKGDSCSIFYGNIIFALLPSIDHNQTVLFCQRLNQLARDAKIAVRDTLCEIKLSYSILHLKESNFKSIDDMMNKAVGNLDKADKENGFFLETVAKKTNSHGEDFE